MKSEYKVLVYKICRKNYGNNFDDSQTKIHADSTKKMIVWKAKHMTYGLDCNLTKLGVCYEVKK